MSGAHTESPPQAQARRARLRDVAREAGVSISTASRALRGEACVREEMAERVRRAATAVGYEPRLRERGRFRSGEARSGKKQVLGRVLILTPASNPDAAASAPKPVAPKPVVPKPVVPKPVVPKPVMPERVLLPKLLEGIALTLRGAGFEPLFAEDAADLPPPAPRGAIAVHLTDGTKRAALNSKVRVVNVGHAPGGRADAVVADDFGGMHQVISEALALGHTRVAVVTGPPAHSSSRARKRAVIAALDEAGLARSQVAWREAGWSIDDGYEAGVGLFGSRRQPTLVACSHDLQALGVVRAAREKGLRVPRDVSITGFGGLAAGPGSRLTITGARVDPYAVGVVAAERLIELLLGPSGPPRTIVLPAVRVAGSTLAVPPARPRRTVGP